MWFRFFLSLHSISSFSLFLQIPSLRRVEFLSSFYSHSVIKSHASLRLHPSNLQKGKNQIAASSASANSRTGINAYEGYEQRVETGGLKDSSLPAFDDGFMGKSHTP